MNRARIQVLNHLNLALKTQAPLHLTRTIKVYNLNGRTTNLPVEGAVILQDLVKNIHDRQLLQRDSHRSKNNKRSASAEAYNKQQFQHNADDTDEEQINNKNEIPQWTLEEIRQLRREGRCFICTEIGHIARDCPEEFGSDTGSNPASNYSEK